MPTLNRFEELDAWRSARHVTHSVYALSRGVELGLRSQVRGAAVSIMANIAEGFESGSDAEFARFLSIAKASAGEVESHLFVLLDLRDLAPSDFTELRAEIAQTKKMIAALISYLRRRKSRHR